jgi:hypothetical protein
MAKAKQRVIMRIEVTAAALASFNSTVEKCGSTHVSIYSRLVQWVSDQDGATQATILGLVPDDVKVDVVRRILDELGRTKK